uniref:B box-type domain-containing protein n=1 Tax=Chromera velia CCMP2878 TaxID=1169474 RepID=A0A0G4I309_9ALVE|eukprot:Cvel_10551.t1-p1 / transcript=Cvel_10551.t1 / gene=Cvel_10551 / organism=Chromera_velia_CCMP2878 / gene_product=hypothetical protein / transcript_product=hypothetical protein / location=Cvel_scaffold639:10351-16031(+) / protein_length=550 / sequence_SO=supercontig / SO=protein_coding / is_pseudo=false
MSLLHGLFGYTPGLAAGLEPRRTTLVEVEPRAERSIHQMQHWEYLLQLSLMDPELHLTRGWLLMKDVQPFVQVMKGALMYSWLDFSQIHKLNTLDGVTNGTLHAEWTKMLLPVGAIGPPKGLDKDQYAPRYFVLCQIATGRCLARPRRDLPATQRELEETDVPDLYHSIAYFDTETRQHTLSGVGGGDDEGKGGGEGGNLGGKDGEGSKEGEQAEGDATGSGGESKGVPWFRQDILVRRAEQVLPVALVEARFERLRIQVARPVCEMCEKTYATVWCGADRSCWLLLCPHCVLIGHHSSEEFFNHSLVSTLDAFKLAMRGKSPSDRSLRDRQVRLLEAQKKRHKEMSEIHSNFERLQGRLDVACKNLITHVRSVRDQKLKFLQSIKRELLSELLLIEWLEAYFQHSRLCLEPAAFLQAFQRHQLLLRKLFASREAIEIDQIPEWVRLKLVVDGGLLVSVSKELPFGEDEEPHWQEGGAETREVRAQEVVGNRERESQEGRTRGTGVQHLHGSGGSPQQSPFLQGTGREEAQRGRVTSRREERGATDFRTN